MTTKKEGPGKDDVRAGDASQPKKPYATIDLKATEVEIKDAKPQPAAATTGTPPSAAASAPKPVDPAKPAAATGGTTSTAAKPADTKPSEGKPADSKPAATAAKPGDSKPATAQPTRPADPPRRSGGFGSFLSHMAAGIAGGFLALLGADTLGPQIAQLGLPIGPGSGTGLTAEMQKRIAALEQAPKPSAAPGAELVKKIADAEPRLAKLDELSKSVATVATTQGKLAADTQALADKLAKQSPADEAVARVTKLEDRLATMAAAADSNPSAGRVPQLAAITGKVADLETTLNNQLGAMRKSVAEQIESRVTVIAEGAEAAKSGTVRMDRDVSALKAETAKLGTRMETLKADGDRVAETLRVVQAETGGIKSALDGLKGDVDAKLKTLARPTDVAAAVTPVTSKLSSLEQSLQSVVKSEEDRKANAERIVLSLELGNLKRVLDRGQKYAAELAEVQKAAGGKLDLAALDRYKDQGVTTVADLGREFRALTGAILDAESDAADGSVVDRLWAGAKSVVRVRKVSHTADDKSAEAVVGRMEQALKDNRLGEVIEQSKLLPAKAVEPAKGWLAKVDARATVDRALAAVEAQLKSSLAGTSSK
jgi:hypothetical protein